jgi:hypothetical protein
MGITVNTAYGQSLKLDQYLVACYDFEETNNPFRSDTSDYNYIDGYFGRGISLDENHIEVSTITNLMLHNNFTLGLWIKPSALSGFNPLFYQKSLDSTFTFEFGLFDGSPYFMFKDSEGVQKDIWQEIKVEKDKWQFIAFNFNCCQLNVTYDCTTYSHKKEYNINLKKPIKKNKITIGKSNNGAYVGLLDEIMVYSHSISESKIQNLCLGLIPFTPKNRPNANSRFMDCHNRIDTIIDTIDIFQQTFQLRIWDSEKYDQDVISVYYNNMLVVDSLVLPPYETSFTSMELTASSTRLNQLKFYSINEGDIPPNTAMISLIYPDSTSTNYPIKFNYPTNGVLYLRHK